MLFFETSYKYINFATMMVTSLVGVLFFPENNVPNNEEYHDN